LSGQNAERGRYDVERSRLDWSAKEEKWVDLGRVMVI